MLLTFSLLLIFHLAQFTRFRGGFIPNPTTLLPLFGPLEIELARCEASCWLHLTLGCFVTWLFPWPWPLGFPFYPHKQIYRAHK